MAAALECEVTRVKSSSSRSSRTGTVGLTDKLAQALMPGFLDTPVAPATAPVTVEPPTVLGQEDLGDTVSDTPHLKTKLDPHKKGSKTYSYSCHLDKALVENFRHFCQESTKI